MFPRPGLTHFMDTLSNLYEMHVYTMGTRTYANAICKALDPSGKWFGERVLTRNESGSKPSPKGLHRSPRLTPALRRTDEKSEALVPIGSKYGCDHRRSSRCLGLEPKSRQSCAL